MVSSSTAGTVAGRGHEFVVASPSPGGCHPVSCPSSLPPSSARPPSPFVSPPPSVCSPSASPFRQWDSWEGETSRAQNSCGTRPTYGIEKNTVGSRRGSTSRSPSSDCVCSNSSCSCHDPASSGSLSSSFSGERRGSDQASGTLRATSHDSKNALSRTGNRRQDAQCSRSFLAEDSRHAYPPSSANGLSSRCAEESFAHNERSMYYLQYSPRRSSDGVPDSRAMSPREATRAVAHTSSGGFHPHVPVSGSPVNKAAVFPRVSSFESQKVPRWNAAEQRDSDHDASPQKLWSEQSGVAVPASPTSLRRGAASSPGCALLSTPGRGPLLLSELDTPFDLVRMNKGIAFLAGKHAKHSGGQGPAVQKYVASLPFSPLRQEVSEARPGHTFSPGREGKTARNPGSEGACRSENPGAEKGPENWQTQGRTGSTVAFGGDKFVCPRDTQPVYSADIAVSFGRQEESSPLDGGTGGREGQSPRGSRQTRVDESDGASRRQGALSRPPTAKAMQTAFHRGEEARDHSSERLVHNQQDRRAEQRHSVRDERRRREPAECFRQSLRRSAGSSGSDSQQQDFGSERRLPSENRQQTQERQGRRRAMLGEADSRHVNVSNLDSYSASGRSSSLSEQLQGSTDDSAAELSSHPRRSERSNAGGETRVRVRTLPERTTTQGSHLTSPCSASSVTRTSPCSSLQVGKVSPTSAAAQEILRSRQLLEAAERMLRGEKGGGDRTSRRVERHLLSRQSGGRERRRKSEGVRRQTADGSDTSDEPPAKVRSHSAPLAVVPEGFPDGVTEQLASVTETREENPLSHHLSEETSADVHEFPVKSTPVKKSVISSVASGGGEHAADRPATTLHSEGVPLAGLGGNSRLPDPATIREKEAEGSRVSGTYSRGREGSQYLQKSSMDTSGEPQHSAGHQETHIIHGRGNPLLGSWLLVDGTEGDAVGSGQSVPVRTVTSKDGDDKSTGGFDDELSRPGGLQKREDNERPQVAENRREGEKDQFGAVRISAKEGYRLANSRCTTAGSEPFSSFSSSSSSGLTGSGMLNSGTVTPAQVSDSTSSGRLQLFELGRWEQGSSPAPSPYTVFREGRTAPSSLSTTISPLRDGSLRRNGSQAAVAAGGGGNCGSVKLGCTDIHSGLTEEMQPGVTLPPSRVQVPESSPIEHKNKDTEGAPGALGTGGGTGNGAEETRPESDTQNAIPRTASKLFASHLERSLFTSRQGGTFECSGSRVQDERSACGMPGKGRATPASALSAAHPVSSRPSSQFSSGSGVGLEGLRGPPRATRDCEDLTVERPSPYYHSGTPTSSPGRHPHPLACTADFGVAATTDTENTPPASCRSASPSGYSSSPSSFYHRKRSFGLPSSSLPRGAGHAEGDSHSSAENSQGSYTRVYRRPLGNDGLHHSFLGVFTAAQRADECKQNCEEGVLHLGKSFPGSSESPSPVIGGLTLQRNESDEADSDAALSAAHSLQACEEEGEQRRHVQGIRGRPYPLSHLDETKSPGSLCPYRTDLSQGERIPVHAFSGKAAGRLVSCTLASKPSNTPLRPSAGFARADTVVRLPQSASGTEGFAPSTNDSGSGGVVFVEASLDFPSHSYLSGNEVAERPTGESIPSAQQQQVFEGGHYYEERQEVAFTLESQAGHDERFTDMQPDALWPAGESGEARSGDGETVEQRWSGHAHLQERGAYPLPLEADYTHDGVRQCDETTLAENQQMQANMLSSWQGVSAQPPRRDRRDVSLSEEDAYRTWEKGALRGPPALVLHAHQHEGGQARRTRELWEQGAAENEGKWFSEEEEGSRSRQPVTAGPRVRPEEEESSHHIQGDETRGHLFASPQIPFGQNMGRANGIHLAGRSVSESPRELTRSEVHRRHCEIVARGDADILPEHHRPQARSEPTPAERSYYPRKEVGLVICGKEGIKEEPSQSLDFFQLHGDGSRETLSNKVKGESDRGATFDENTEAAVEVMVQFMNQELQAAGFHRIDTGGPPPRRQLGSRRISTEEAVGVSACGDKDTGDSFSSGRSRGQEINPDDDVTTEAFIETDVYVHRVLEGMADKLHEVLVAYKSRGERLGILRREASSVGSLEVKCNAIREEKEEAEKQVASLRSLVSQLQRETEEAASTRAQLTQTQLRLEAAQKKIQAARRQLQMQTQQVRLKEREKEKLKEQLDAFVREDEQRRLRARRTLQDLFPSQGPVGGLAPGGGFLSPRTRQRETRQVRKTFAGAGGGGAGGSRSIQQERQLTEVSRYYEARIAGLQREVKSLTRALRETQANLEEVRQGRMGEEEIGALPSNWEEQELGVFRRHKAPQVIASFSTTITPTGALKAYAEGEDASLLRQFREGEERTCLLEVSSVPPLLEPSPCHVLDYASTVKGTTSGRRSRSLGASFVLASSGRAGDQQPSKFSSSCFAGFFEGCSGRRESGLSTSGRRLAADGDNTASDAKRWLEKVGRLEGALENLSRANRKLEQARRAEAEAQQGLRLKIAELEGRAEQLESELQARPTREAHVELQRQILELQDELNPKKSDEWRLADPRELIRQDRLKHDLRLASSSHGPLTHEESVALLEVSYGRTRGSTTRKTAR
ncbi:hypothetical protein CSUI_004004 [Cystoisospora suis]|uniref:Uncharacterized protein n=1 Tax=Cystoisospora suis TaxID=483139 RepID=A0A2C6L251_9APIC|nr:hypothetical protein CSUI_004004 [Cystoisospora suis]